MTARVPGASDDGVPRDAHDDDAFEGDKTRHGMGFGRVAQGAPAAPVEHAEQVAPAAPVEVARPERSEPIRVFSMKDQSAPHRRNEEARAPLHVQLRSLAEVSRRHNTPPAGLGRLAPPRDARQAQARRRRGNLGWACIALVLAAAISLAIWLAAGR